MIFSPVAKSVRPLCSKWVKELKGKSAALEIGNHHHIDPITSSDVMYKARLFVRSLVDLTHTKTATANIAIFFRIDSAGDIDIISPKQPQFSVSPIAHK